MPDLCIRQIRKRIPAARDDACKEWQEVSTQSVQTDDVKGDVRSFGSQGIFSNGNGMRYLQKKELTADENCSLMESSFMRNLTKEGPQLEKKLVLIECRVLEPIWASPQQINNHSSWLST